jgi:hypothetical protein
LVQDSAAPDELNLGHMARDDIVRVSHLTRTSTRVRSRMKYSFAPTGAWFYAPSRQFRPKTYHVLFHETTSLPQSTRLFIFKIHLLAVQAWNSGVIWQLDCIPVCGRLCRVYVQESTRTRSAYALTPYYLFVSSHLELWKDSIRKRREQTRRTSCGSTLWNS